MTQWTYKIIEHKGHIHPSIDIIMYKDGVQAAKCNVHLHDAKGKTISIGHTDMVF